MVKTFLVAAGLMYMIVAGSGCETVKGATNGAKQDIGNTIKNVAGNQGFIMRSDRWFKENAW